MEILFLVPFLIFFLPGEVHGYRNFWEIGGIHLPDMDAGADFLQSFQDKLAEGNCFNRFFPIFSLYCLRICYISLRRILGHGLQEILHGKIGVVVKRLGLCPFLSLCGFPHLFNRGPLQTVVICFQEVGKFQ